MKKFLLAIVMTFGCATAFAAGLGDLPVQQGGRVKPFETFARESLHLVHGKQSYQGKKATDVVMSWLLVPQEWDKKEIILIRHAGLREALGLDHVRLYYSLDEILANPKVGPLIQELAAKTQAQEKLDPFYQSVQTLQGQLTTFQAIRLGLGIQALPNKENSTWLHIGQFTPEWQDRFKAITTAFAQKIMRETNGESTAEAEKALDEAVQNFVGAIEKDFGDYSHRGKIKAENMLTKIAPFRWAWILYFLALIFFSFAYFGSRTAYGKIGWGLTGLAILFHVLGFSFRVYILGRPPVSNMYETVVWVAFINVFFAAILYRWLKYKILPVGATLVATLCLILADISSEVLDPSLGQLEPVLRDNFWLLTHVIIIVSSYAAFFLAFFIGDIVLYFAWKDEKKYAQQIKDGAQAIYRSMQIGIVLLAAGTILGGVWADYSWGRFWGWDPKETWAFIALMGYLAVLHARLTGWLKDFGLATSAVITFSLVIMAWYGVNFVLGAGLHTYGFGAGGIEYVAGFVAIHFLWVVFVATLRQSRLKALKTNNN